jgi:flagellar biosynthesis GTPase FlhF
VRGWVGGGGWVQIPAHWHAVPIVRVSKVPAEATEQEVRVALAGVGDVKSAVLEGNGVWYARVAPAEGDGIEQLRAKVSSAMRAKGAADRKEKAAKKEAAKKAEDEAAAEAAEAAKQEAEQEPAAVEKQEPAEGEAKAVEEAAEVEAKAAEEAAEGEAKASEEAAEGEAKAEVNMEEVKAEETTEEVKMKEAEKAEEAKKEEAARKQEEEDALAGDAVTIHGVRVHLDHVEKPSWFLFIGNLCASYDDAKLLELFGQCGSTERCFVMTNKDGTTKG